MAIAAVLLATGLMALPFDRTAEALSPPPPTVTLALRPTGHEVVATGWTNPQNAYSSNNVYATASPGRNVTHTGRFLNFGFDGLIPAGSIISSVKVKAEYRLSTSSSDGRLGLAAVYNNANCPGTSIKFTTQSTSDMFVEANVTSCRTWAIADFNNASYKVRAEAIHGDDSDNITISLDDIYTEVIYQKPTTYTAQLDQTGYIWENDDEDEVAGDAFDENTQQAAGGAAITGVRAGERLNARVQVRTSGTTGISADAGLFYDRNDGKWTRAGKAPPPTPSGAVTCSNADYKCLAVVPQGPAASSYTSTAIDGTGTPWVAFARQSGTDWQLWVARYVGTGGTNCTSTAWTCTTIHTGTGSFGFTPSLGFDAAGNAWVAWHDATNLDLVVSKYVGTGGTGCTSTAWQCWRPSTTGSTGTNVSMTFAGDGSPRVSFIQGGNTLVMASYVAAAGTGCDDAAWTCSTVDTAGNEQTSIAIEFTGDAWIAYRDTTGYLRIARNVGAGGTGCTGGGTAWLCAVVANVAIKYPSLAFDGGGTAWIAYQDATNLDQKIARYVAASGTGCANATWNCTTVEGSGGVNAGYEGSLAIDAAGRPWISHYSTAGGARVKLSRFVGTGGTGCNDAGWSCEEVDYPSHGVGNWSSLAFDGWGRPWVSYNDPSDGTLRMAVLNRGGEMRTGMSLGGATGDLVNESHADMTSVTDTVGRDDADCIGGGTWNAGRFSESDSVSLALAAGRPTAQCTELSFSVDTSAALSGFTYRFVVATNDNWRKDRGMWRGPDAITAYPTLTTAATPDMRYSKDVSATWADCADVSWGCLGIDTTGAVGEFSEIAIDAAGSAWVAYYESTGNGLKVANYVGSGGTGCAAGVVSWTCVAVDTAGNVGGTPSIAFDRGGFAWVAYRDATNTGLKLAKYVGGSSGAGCASTAWTCSVIDSTGDPTSPSLAFDGVGTASVSYRDQTSLDLRIARFVTSGGAGCESSTAWSCVAIDSTGDVGSDSSLAADAAGNLWASYYDATNLDLKLAKYVAVGGTGCATPAWTCMTVDSTSSVGDFTSLAVDASGNPWVSYRTFTGYDLKVARYVGSGGTGCASAAWTCTAVDTGNSVGGHTSIALDAAGNAWVSYFDSTALDLKLARHVGSGGTGCASTAWTCAAVDTTGTAGQYTSIAFDASSIPWVSYWDGTNSDLKVAKLHSPAGKPVTSSGIAHPGRSASRSDGRYRLDHGDTARPAAGACDAAAPRNGYCGVSVDDTYFDSVTAQANEKPSFLMSVSRNVNSRLTLTWRGKSTGAPSTRALGLETWRGGTTNAWEALTTTANTCASSAANTDCIIEASIGPSTSAEYHEQDGARYWLHVRVSQVSDPAVATTLSTDVLEIVDNRAPSTPTNLAQKTSSDVVIATGATTNEATVKFVADVSELDAPDSVQLCVEVDPLGTAFSNTEDACGSAVTLNGAALEASIFRSVMGGQSYHWQVRVKDAGGLYSAWVAYGANAESAADFISSAPANSAPNAPSSLVQQSAADVTIATGAWHNSTTVKFVASATDPDGSDTLALCVEVKLIGVAFTDTEDACGSPAPYSGSAVTATVSRTLSDASQYHWQVRLKDTGGLYSSWVTYGGNTEAEQDVAIDTTAPTGGTVYDGTNNGVDAGYNDGSLSSLSANWTGFVADVSGLSKYEYSIGTSAGTTNVLSWTNHATAVSVTATGLTLRTGVTYYFNVRVTDNAGNTAVVSSNGQQVAPTLTFTVVPNTEIVLTHIPATGLNTDTESATLTTSTNGYGGYSIRAYASTLPFAAGGNTIADFTGGTYNAPDSWQPGDTGLGYTSSDTDIGGVNKFQAATCLGGSLKVGLGCYAPFPKAGPGDVVADHTSNVSGAPIVGETFTFTYRTTTDALQPAGRYVANVTFTNTVTY